MCEREKEGGQEASELKGRKEELKGRTYIRRNDRQPGLDLGLAAQPNIHATEQLC